ncbi:MAG TPA: PadR family transcriptional regulator, partial [Planctomycetaceae bacterium]
QRRTNPDFLNGVPEMLLLHLLSRRPMYGYELVQEIRAATGEALSFGEGCVYPLLHRLETDGMLASERTEVGGRSRVVYRVTKAGAKRLKETVSTWSAVTEAIRTALEGGRDARPALA